jgi:putative ABC transport system ATP-binding protein
VTVTCTELVKEYVTPAETIRALDGVSLDVEEGEFLALEGASGSGKSTLLNLIAGLDEPTSGAVQVAGHQLHRLSTADRGRLRLKSIGVVFQDNNLIAEFSILENILVPLRALGLDPTAARREARRALDRLGIGDLADRRPRDVSGGQRQRGGIARAIAGSRRVLLADEPTGALDSHNSIALFETLRELARQGTTVIVATHDPLVSPFVDRVLRLRDGRLETPGEA